MRPPGHLARPGLGQLLAGGLLGAVMSSARRRESTRTHQVVRCRVLGAGTRADGGNSVTFATKQPSCEPHGDLQSSSARPSHGSPLAARADLCSR